MIRTRHQTPWIIALLLWGLIQPADAHSPSTGDLPDALATVLDRTTPLSVPRKHRMPMYVLPISGSLAAVDDTTARWALEQLAVRGIGYTVEWNADDFAKSSAEAIRIGRLQTELGMPVAANANACLYSFFDGTPQTLHVDGETGERFAETSFGGSLGCPFALEHRIPPMRQRVEQFLLAYRQAGLSLDFVLADWEIDGPLEWNDAWASSKRCRRCRQAVDNIHDFRKFQRTLRELRSTLQREVLGQNVTRYFPQALVGNYAVYPHGGLRYWYDYFEREADGVPYRLDQRARYREWHHEFNATKFTFAMPVVYTWYGIFNWYDFEDLDYRWFYNMLLVGSNAGRHTPVDIPTIPFVHWHTTAPPERPDPHVAQFSADKYQQLLWHLLLRGHDTFFLWCTSSELGREIELVHSVYAESLAYDGFLNRGTPISFEVPQQPRTVVSGLRLGDHVLAVRSNFGTAGAEQSVVSVSDTEFIRVGDQDGPQVIAVERTLPDSRGRLKVGNKLRLPIGFYELPDDNELRKMASAGVNLVRCGNRADLDRVQRAGMQGWVSLPVQQGATDELRQAIESVKDHPALAIWEGPDEIVWMFTAYSGLQRTAGFSRDDWIRQIPKAVQYANQEGNKNRAADPRWSSVGA